MDQNGILLMTITVFAAITTIGVWGILFVLVRSRSGANDERNAAIRGITEECAEADRVLSSSAKAAMSAHSFKSALSPKIEKIRKMLTTNMHILDVYFVKYSESRIAAFQEALVSSESESPAPVFPIDKFLSEAKPAPVAAENKPKGLPSDAVVHDLRSRVGVMPMAMTPPAIDLRTGIITVSQEEPKAAKPPAPNITALHTEKTMKWDRNELKGLTGKPESIVVEGAEQPKPAGTAAPQPGSKNNEAMISGEDIENTMDSFFGLGDK